MFISNSKVSKLATVLAILSLLALSPSSAARDAGPVVPMGALAHAVGAIEGDIGGKVLEIRLENVAGPPGFEAALAKGDGVLYMHVGSVSDDVTQIEVRNLPPWLLDYHLEAYMRSIDKAEVPLTSAILRAEERSGGAAIGAGLAKPLGGTNAVLAYFVETIQDHRRESLAVDARTGAFIENPQSLYEARTPVDLARRLAP
jgi:uncharacterized membrane protein YkoI